MARKKHIVTGNAHVNAWEKYEVESPTHWLQLQARNYYKYGRMRFPQFGQGFVCYPRTKDTFSKYQVDDRYRFNSDPNGYAPYIAEDLDRNEGAILEIAIKSGLTSL